MRRRPQLGQDPYATAVSDLYQDLFNVFIDLLGYELPVLPRSRFLPPSRFDVSRPKITPSGTTAVRACDRETTDERGESDAIAAKVLGTA